MQPFHRRIAGLSRSDRFSGENMTNIVLGTVALAAAAIFTATTADVATAEVHTSVVVADH